MSDNTVAVLDSVSRFLDRQHGLYIDGQWRASAAEGRLAVYNPANGQQIATTADANEHDVAAGGAVRPQSLQRRRLGAASAGRARTHPAALRRSGGAARRRAGAARNPGAGQIHQHRPRFRSRQHPELDALHRRAGDQNHRPDAGRLHSDAAGRQISGLYPQRADRRGRRHRALELPADDRHVESDAGAGRGLLHRHQAVGNHPAHPTAHRRTGERSRRAARRVQRGHRPRHRVRQGADRTSADRQSQLYRLHAGGQKHRARGGGSPDPRDAGAGRQKPGHRAERCRSAAGDRRPDARQFPQPRAGVRRQLANLY
ncbi:Phenylacetaldehyde dehydrogenase [Serratia marcescens]|uniref:Phenylacetaldehyde dehydrogenase n=1 Tax=Serratia marcescens TaxID=615 RepID=A0A380ATS7_SERMA|nr:Phenylacetaldehyde dehydrogenase [Serratia marcescens]